MIDYFKAAEAEIQSLPDLHKSIKFLKARQQRLLEKGKPRKAKSIEFDKPYVDAETVNDTLSEVLALSEVANELKRTKENIHDIEEALSSLPKEWQTVLEMFYHRGFSAEKIAEEISVSTVKTVYNIRNSAVAKFALIYYGASAKGANKFGKK